MWNPEIVCLVYALNLLVFFFLLHSSSCPQNGLWGWTREWKRNSIFSYWFWREDNSLSANLCFQGINGDVFITKCVWPSQRFEWCEWPKGEEGKKHCQRLGIGFEKVLAPRTTWEQYSYLKDGLQSFQQGLPCPGPQVEAGIGWYLAFSAFYTERKLTCPPVRLAHLLGLHVFHSAPHVLRIIYGVSRPWYHLPISVLLPVKAEEGSASSLSCTGWCRCRRVPGW